MKKKKEKPRRNPIRNKTLVHSWHTNFAHAKNEVLKALQAHGGRVELAAEDLRVTKKTVYRWLEKPENADLKKAWEQIKEAYHR